MSFIVSSVDLQLFDNRSIVEECMLRNKYRITAIIDTESDDYEFIDLVTAQEICQMLKIEPVELVKYKIAKRYDDKKRPLIIHVIYSKMIIEPHSKSLATLMITFLTNYSIILSRLGLMKHEIIIDVDAINSKESMMKGKKDHCTYFDASSFPFPRLSSKKSEGSTIKKTATSQLMKIFTRSSKTPETMPNKESSPALTSVDFDLLKKKKSIESNLSSASMQSKSKKTSKTKKKRMLNESGRGSIESLKDSIESKQKDIKMIMNIATIDAASFNLLIRRKDVEIFAVSFKDINFEMTKKTKKMTDPKIVMSEKYHDFLDVFSKKEADRLPPHRKYDHRIELKEKKEASTRTPLYQMFEQKLKLLKTYLEKHLDKEFIKTSSALFASLILFAKKPDGELRFCVDYQKLNEITKKNGYLIPLITDLMTRLSRTKYLTKIDIRHVFNKIRMIIERDENLTTFRTRFDSYKYLIMSFGLTNELFTFQNFMNDILMKYLDKFVIVYFDDILIYSDNLKDHKSHVRKMLKKLKESEIQADIDKCEFHQTETKFLDVFVRRDGIQINSAKIVAIVAGNTPQNLQQVQSFFEFVNFYRRFIRGFFKIVRLLIRLIRKDKEFKGILNCQKTFEELKNRVNETSMLAHFNSSRKTTVESDSSDYVSAKVLSQKKENDVMRPVAYFSKTLLFVECNYEIYDKELLAIIKCFEEGQPELQSMHQSIKVLIDYKTLKYFMTIKKLNRKQAKWAEFLTDFNFVISYQVGQIHGKADSLTRRSGDKPVFDEDDRQKHQMQTILTSDRLDKQIKIKTSDYKDIEVAKMNKLKFEAFFKIFVLEDKRLDLLKEIHNQSTIKHSGERQTLQMMQRFFEGPKMREEIKQYVQNCHVCKRSKTPKKEYQRELQPIESKNKSWQDILLDFVIGFFESNGFNAILMIIDRFFKMHYYIACTAEEEETSVEKTSKMLIDNVGKLHGLLKTMISNRGPQFISLVGKTLCNSLKIKAKLSTAFHPEINEQSERSNQEMKQYLRAYVNYQQDDGSSGLSMIEYVFNASTSASFILFSFFVNYGFESRMSFDFIKAKSTTREKISKQKAKNIHQIMKKIGTFANEQLNRVKADQKRHVDKRQKKTPNYQTKNKIGLSTKNLKTVKPSKKLNDKLIKSFRILKVKKSNAKLELSESMKIHNNFHVFLFRKNSDNSLLDQVQSSSPSVIIENEEKGKINDILDFRRFERARKLQYRASGIDHSSDFKWYDASDFNNVKKIVQNFHQRYSNKPSGTLTRSMKLGALIRRSTFQKEGGGCENSVSHSFCTNQD